LESGTGGFSKHWMARGAPQESSRKFFQALEKMARIFPSLGKRDGAEIFSAGGE
jgi:hypothetical protein